MNHRSATGRSQLATSSPRRWVSRCSHSARVSGSCPGFDDLAWPPVRSRSCRNSSPTDRRDSRQGRAWGRRVDAVAGARQTGGSQSTASVARSTSSPPYRHTHSGGMSPASTTRGGHRLKKKKGPPWRPPHLGSRQNVGHATRRVTDANGRGEGRSGGRRAGRRNTPGGTSCPHIVAGIHRVGLSGGPTTGPCLPVHAGQLKGLFDLGTLGTQRLNRTCKVLRQGASRGPSTGQ